MIKVTCGKCGKEIKDEYAYVFSGFYKKSDNREGYIVGFCANIDDHIFCDACYSEFVHREED